MIIYNIDSARRRFLKKIRKTRGCWLWTGKLNRETRYGCFMLKTLSGWRSFTAHHAAWLLFVDINIPGGHDFHVDHLCRVRHCVKWTKHLEHVPGGVNVLRGTGVTATNLRKTHCMHGHRFTAENTYITPCGHRQCIECRRRIGREFDARRRPRRAA